MSTDWEFGEKAISCWATRFLTWKSRWPQAAIPLDLDRAEGGSGAELFALLQARQGADFRGYKDSTLTRRLQRRMVARDVADLGAYVALCREDAAELDALFRDLLVAYQRSPEVTRQRIFLETMEVVFPQVKNKIVLDKDLKGVLPLLSLDTEVK